MTDKLIASPTITVLVHPKNFYTTKIPAVYLDVYPVDNDKAKAYRRLAQVIKEKITYYEARLDEA